MIETIAICGRTCAGKTLAGNHLAAKLGVMHIEASSIMRDVWRTSGSSLTLDEFAEQLLLESPERVPKAAAKMAEGRPLVVTGLRSPDEVAELNDARGGTLVIFIDAGPETRFARSIIRNRPGHPQTLRDLDALDHVHDRMGLGKIEAEASTLKLVNEREIECLHRSLKKLVFDHFGRLT